MLVLVWRYGKFKIPEYTRSTVFMHEGVVELVNERFVALRLDNKMDAPFRSQEIYGMSATTFGAAILLVTHEGKVVRETQSLHPEAIYDFLLDGLERHPKFAGKNTGESKDVLVRALRMRRRGDLKFRSVRCLDFASRVMSIRFTPACETIVIVDVLEFSSGVEGGANRRGLNRFPVRSAGVQRWP